MDVKMTLVDFEKAHRSQFGQRDQLLDEEFGVS